MFSYYKTHEIHGRHLSIIYTFNTHGKRSNPQDHHLSHDAIIRNYEHYLQHRIRQSKCYLQKYFETYPIISNITTIAQRPIASIYEKPKKYLLIKVHEE